MKEYSSYTTADFLNDDLFLFWYYSGEGDYYRKIIADCPDREPYLKEAMERLAALKWEKPVLPPKEVDNACLKLEQAIQNRKMSQRKHRLYKMVERFSCGSYSYPVCFGRGYLEKCSGN